MFLERGNYSPATRVFRGENPDKRKPVLTAGDRPN
jgi:hypothetical protein